MSALAIFILAVSMSADAFAAAVARGAAERPHWRAAVKGGLLFGVVEAITPIIGWALGTAASSYVEAVDHWIAFFLLSAVGGKLIWEGLNREESQDEEPRKSGFMGSFLTAVGTSLDAAAVGISLAFLDVNIVTVALAIGASTFFFATLGLMIGKRVGARVGPAAEIAGGLALMAIGAFILLEHTGVIGAVPLPG